MNYNDYENINNEQYDNNNFSKYFNKKNITIFSVVIGIIIVILIIIIVKFSTKTDNYQKMEQELEKNVISYMSSNVLDLNNTNFISFQDLNFTPDVNLNCDINGGVIINSTNNKDFDYLYQCESKTSTFLDNILKINKQNEQYISLRGNSIVYVDYYDEYEDLGYNSEYEAIVTNTLENQAGVYQISYIINENGNTYHATRVVVIRKTKEIKTSAPTITLNPDSISLYVNEEFIEPKILAYDEIDGDITDNVTKEGNVDNSVPGTYAILYKVTNSKGLSTEATLKVEVIEDNNEYNILLEGDDVVYLNYLEEYVEPGYTAHDSNNKDVTNKVIVNNNIKSDTPGIYEVNYTIGKTTVKRSVVVSDQEITINSNYSPTSLTNSSVTINLTVTGNNVAFILLPDGNVATDKNVTYVVKENDDYEFKIFNKKGEYQSKIISISNIDNESPNGSCIVDNNVITVNATDDTGISGYSYLYDGKNYTEYTTNSTYKLASYQEIVAVKIKDKLGNEETILCDFKNQVYAPIEPLEYELTNGEIVMQEEKDTLKFWVVKTKKNGKTYYVTRIWMEDPFNQIKKYYSHDMGVKSTTLNKLADKVESKTKNKAVIAINSDNGSCYDCINIRYGEFISMNVNRVHPYRNHTSIINQDGYLQVFSDRRTSGKGKTTPANRLEEVTEQRQAIVDAKPNLTINPSKLVVKNGNFVHFGGGHGGRRTMICQVNRNNWFVFVSSSSYAEVNGATQELLKLGGQNCINLDGGSSSALYAKKSTNSSFKTYIKPGDSHPSIYTDILYFTE